MDVPKEEREESRRGSRRTRPHTATGLYLKSGDGLRLRHRRVRRLVQKMLSVMTWIEPSDMPCARAWAELEILGANVFAELIANGVTNLEGEPRRLLTELRQLRQAQLAYARELGMTPAARMAIKANGTRAAVDLAAVMVSLEQSRTDSNEVGESTDRIHRTPGSSSKHRPSERTEKKRWDEEREDVD
jgi:hypothetical protein